MLQSPQGLNKNKLEEVLNLHQVRWHFHWLWPVHSTKSSTVALLIIICIYTNHLQKPEGRYYSGRIRSVRAYIYHHHHITQALNLSDKRDQKHQGCRRSIPSLCTRPSCAPAHRPPFAYNKNFLSRNVPPLPKLAGEDLYSIPLSDLVDVQLLKPSRGASEEAVEWKSYDLQERREACRCPVWDIAITLRPAASRGEISPCRLFQQRIPHVHMLNVGEWLTRTYTLVRTPLLVACSNQGACHNIS